MKQPRRYKRRPTEVHAMQLQSDNRAAILEWGNGKVRLSFHGRADYLVIDSLEGALVCHPHDWIVRGELGEYWVVADERFPELYQAVPAKEPW